MTWTPLELQHWSRGGGWPSQTSPHVYSMFAHQLSLCRAALGFSLSGQIKAMCAQSVALNKVVVVGGGGCLSLLWTFLLKLLPFMLSRTSVKQWELTPHPYAYLCCVSSEELSVSISVSNSQIQENVVSLSSILFQEWFVNIHKSDGSLKNIFGLSPV